MNGVCGTGRDASTSYHRPSDDNTSLCMTDLVFLGYRRGFGLVMLSAGGSYEGRDCAASLLVLRLWGTGRDASTSYYRPSDDNTALCMTVLREAEFTKQASEVAQRFGNCD